MLVNSNGTATIDYAPNYITAAPNAGAVVTAEQPPFVVMGTHYYGSLPTPSYIEVDTQNVREAIKKQV